MQLVTYRARIFTHDRGQFQQLRNAGVLIYFPHGFGDWVQLGYILPLLEPSNHYWITRAGDDNVAVMEDNPCVTPVYLGRNMTRDSEGDAPHFGMCGGPLDGSVMELRVPPNLYHLCSRRDIGAVFWTGFPETAGHVSAPYQSKARNLVPYVVPPERRPQLDLRRPLRNSISFEVTPWLMRWVEALLRNRIGFGERKLCLIGRNGYTSVGKNWGHLWREDLPAGSRREGEECRDFMRIMLRKDRRWAFVSMEDRMFEGEHTLRDGTLHAYSFAELFGVSGSPGIPFGLLMKALINLADLVVGVPAGPYHLSMAKLEVPTIGIWTEHLPGWFDEPKPASMHVVSRNVRDHGLDRRPGSIADSADLEFRLMFVNTRIITGEQAVEAVEALL